MNLLWVKNFIPLHCLAYRRSLLQGLSFDAHMASQEDWDFLLGVCSRAPPATPGGAAVMHKDYVNPGQRRWPARSLQQLHRHPRLPPRLPPLAAPTAAELKAARAGLMKSVGLALPGSGFEPASAHHDQLNASVLTAAVGTAVVGHRGAFPIGNGGHARQRHARPSQVEPDRFGALQALVEVFRPVRVGVALDFQEDGLVVGLEFGDELIELADGLGTQLGVAVGNLTRSSLSSVLIAKVGTGAGVAGGRLRTGQRFLLQNGNAFFAGLDAAVQGLESARCPPCGLSKAPHLRLHRHDLFAHVVLSRTTRQGQRGNHQGSSLSV